MTPAGPSPACPDGRLRAGTTFYRVVTEDGNCPVGLLFVGGDTGTVATAIDLVLSRFGVTVDGQ